ncbi:NAD(P)-binding protein [Xylariaceae sp. FL1651]|nr:NAD(P)-binding protein [Xylariaceae sp. FL1651]
MLVLVAGATGNIGQKIIGSLLRRGHQVRALARSPDKLAPATAAQLERFVRSSAYYDVPALETACAGVDAVICAYNGSAELQVEGQLLLLRAAERAGVRVYVSASWNSDWRRQRLGDHESYDPYHCFHRLAELSSAVRPHFVFTGVLAEVLFSAPGRVSFSPANHGVWDPEAGRVEVWGDPACRWQWTSEADAAEFAAAIVEQENAADGGFWTVCSGYDSLEDIARIYGQVRGTQVKVEQVGSVKELREKALVGRARSHPTTMWDYIGYFYVLYIVDGTWTPCQFDNNKLGVKGTPLEEYLKQNPEI